MTETVSVATGAFESKAPEQESAREEKRGEIPPLELGVFRHWTPTEVFLMSQDLRRDTSYAAGLVLIYARRGITPEILVVRQNENDAEKILQKRDNEPPRTRPDSWKCPIGKFTRDRYIDPKTNRGYLDANLWDTFIEECWYEETGIDLAHVGADEEEENVRIWESVKRSPVFEYRMLSKRKGSDYHVDRIHFFVTPRRFEHNPAVWKKQVELRDVRWFPLEELPRRDLNGEWATMLRSHVIRIVDFFECPQTNDLKWASGIPDDISERIRKRFLEYYSS